jgi:hypothetical protein
MNRSATKTNCSTARFKDQRVVSPRLPGLGRAKDIVPAPV